MLVKDVLKPASYFYVFKQSLQGIGVDASAEGFLNYKTLKLDFSLAMFIETDVRGDPHYHSTH